MLYGNVRPPFDCLIFDDLRTKGYIVHDRSSPMDIRHAEHAVREMASLHAASIMVKQRSSKYNPDQIRKDSFHLFQNYVPRVFETHFARSASLAESLGKPKVYKFLKSLQNLAVDIFYLLLEKDDKWAVYCHGDFLNSNLMFR